MQLHSISSRYILHRMTEETKNVLTEIKQGNDKVLEKIYVKNYRKVERFVVENSGTSADARDIYQESFLSFWRNIQEDKFIPQSEHSLEAYLFTIAKNKWTDYLRSANFKVKRMTNEESTLSQLAELSPEKEEEFENAIAKIKTAFPKIGQNCQELLTQFYYLKQPLKLIATTFGWTEATAKNNKYRCLQKLRELSNSNLK